MTVTQVSPKTIPASGPTGAGSALAAYIGLDWGDQKHAWALQVDGGTTIEQGELLHTPEAVEEWAVGLQQRFPSGRIAVALEQSRGPVVFALSKYAHLALYPIHPTSAAEYRKIFRPSGAKSDGPDARLHLDMLLRHRDNLRPLNPDSVETRTLQFLVEDRRQLVDERTRMGLRLKADLKGYYPQVLQWFAELDAPVALDFLQRWPGVEELHGATAASLHQFLKQHHCVNQETNQTRVQAMTHAVAATHDAAVIAAGQLAVVHAVRLLRELNQSIQEYDAQIAARSKAHPDFAIFASFPGAGPVLIPRLIAAFGTQRDRFQTAREMQQYSGIAPVTERSGTQNRVHWRWSCPKFLRQSFHEWAAQSVAHCEWAAAYYHALRDDKHKSHHAAVRALAYKWIRIVFRCWQDRQPYDDSRYQAAIQTGGRTAQPTSLNELPVRWTACGSFQKLTWKTPEKISKIG